MQPITITLDGPSASGKRTTAQALAQLLGYSYLDTGAMYRGLALFLHEHNIAPDQTDQIVAALETVCIDFDSQDNLLLQGIARESDIRTPAVSELASQYATCQVIRTWLVAQQQRIIAGGGYVLDGRDAGSVVAPRAELKIFLDCNVSVRAQRRARQYHITDSSEIAALQSDLVARDTRDSTRLLHPMQILPESVVVHTDDMTIEQQIDMVYNIACNRINELSRV